MLRKYSFLIFLFVTITEFSYCQIYEQKAEREIITISERVGKEIDQKENQKFKLFLNIIGFQSAVYFKSSDNKYFLEISYLDNKTGELSLKKIEQSEASIKNRGLYIDRFVEGQQEESTQDSIKLVYKEPGTAFFVELIGKPFSGINVDFRINKSSRFSLGIAYYYSYKKEDEEQEEIEVSSFIPNIVYYYLRGEKNKRFEIGAGLGVTPVWHKDYNFDSPIFFHSVIGYRYQKKDGLLFRIGLTFNKYDDLNLFFLGISLGYSL
ncbi:MAG: hypothetical protein ABFS12_13760 [Bacteroidota bacterium]